MTDPARPAPDPSHPRPRGRLGQWSDRVKALLLLSLLAVAGALSGLGSSGVEAERVRDGLSAGSLRTAQTDAPTTFLLTGREQAHPDLSGGDAPPPRALRAGPPVATPPGPPVALAGIVPAGSVRHYRAGHAAHMPTGPPAGLSA